MILLHDFVEFRPDEPLGGNSIIPKEPPVTWFDGLLFVFDVYNLRLQTWFPPTKIVERCLWLSG